MKNLSLFLLLFTLFSPLFSLAQTELSFRIVADSLVIPWEMKFGSDGHLWVTERPGLFSRIHPRTGVKKVILDLRSTEFRAVGEGGLLGFDFMPGFPDSSQELFLTYTFQNAQNRNLEKIVKYTYNPASEQLENPVVLIDNIAAANIHNGSRILIGPDKKIYQTTGDAAVVALSLDTLSLNGKILRINPDGTVPNDNPFPNSYVYTIGHRNPQGLCLNPKTGNLYISDHGANSDDEVNLILRGRNYGWPTVQGYCDEDDEKDYCIQNNVKEPLTAWSPTIAPATLLYYDHPAIPEWRNALLLATMNRSGRDIRLLKLNAEGDSIINQEILFDNRYGRIRAMCVSPTGSLYIGTSNRERNGQDAVQPGDDRIIEIYNPKFTFRSDDLNRFSGVSVYPVPTESEVRFSISISGTLTDMTGRTLQTVRNAERMSLDSYPSGIYYLLTETGQSLKMVKY